MNVFSYEFLIKFGLSVHLRVESAGVVTIKIFRKILFDFKRIIHQTKPIRDPTRVKPKLHYLMPHSKLNNFLIYRFSQA